MTEPRTILAIGASRGGVGDAFARSVGELRARGHTVTVIAVPFGRAPAWRAIATAWRARRALRAATTVHIEFGSGDTEVFWFALAAEALRPDTVLVLHDHPKPAHIPAAALVAGRARGAAVRWLCPWLDPALIRLLIRRAGVVAVFGESARADWLAGGARRVTTVRHGGEPPSPDRVPPSRGESILFAGFIGPGKGVDVLLAAWRELRGDVPLPLLLAGAADPPNDTWLEALLAEAAAGPNPPRWLGPIPGEAEFDHVIARAAVVVLPYRRSSPASGILVRAMSAGRAVVATEVPAVAGVVRDGENGLVVPAEDPAALAAAIRRLVHEPETRDQLGAAAAATAAGLFSWAAHAADVERAYDLAHAG